MAKKPEPKMSKNEQEALTRLLNGLNKLDSTPDRMLDTVENPSKLDVGEDIYGSDQPVDGNIPMQYGNPAHADAYLQSMNGGGGPMTDAEVGMADNAHYFDRMKMRDADYQEQKRYQPTQQDVTNLQNQGVLRNPELENYEADKIATLIAKRRMR